MPMIPQHHKQNKTMCTATITLDMGTANERRRYISLEEHMIPGTVLNPSNANLTITLVQWNGPEEYRQIKTKH